MDAEVVISREELETLTEHIVESSFVTVADVVSAANLEPQDIDQIILVGGQSRMPIIQAKIESFFVQAPAKTVHPDEAFPGAAGAGFVERHAA